MKNIFERNFRRRFAILGSAAVLLWLAGVDSAFAHARLVKSDPADKAVLKAAPGRIDLWFNELLDEGFNSIEVFPASELTAATHTNLALDKPKVDPKDATHLFIGLPSLKPGEYSVQYRVLSRDGHTAPGRITFQVS